MSIHDPAKRLLIIGLDGGTWDILGPLCDLGEMPHLNRLRSRSAWASLLSTQPPFTAPAWATFATGLNPGQHGILNFIHVAEPDPAKILRMAGTPVNGSLIHSPTLWDYLGEQGKRLGVINLPLSYPLRRPRGTSEEHFFAISGMLTPPGRIDTIPPELATRLSGYVVDLDYGRPGKALKAEDLPGPEKMLQDISQMTERRGFHALQLSQQYTWDVMMVVFTGTDRLFHHFWHYLQRGANTNIHGLQITISEKLRSYFGLLDSILGSLVQTVGGDTNIIILSDHGFGPAATHWLHLNNWLLELDLLRLKHTSTGWMQRLKRNAPWLSDIAKSILPKEARDSVRTFGHLADAIDWQETQAWAVPLYNNVAGIYLHSRQRFPEGILAQGEVEQLRQKLLFAAASLRQPGSSRRLVLDIQRREELYDGPAVSSFPDLILTFDPDFAVVPTLGSTLITPIPQIIRSGDHRPHGIFLASGPNIRPRALATTPRLIDLAPTILHLADTPIPQSMEGRVLTEVFHDGYLILHPPIIGSTLPDPSPEIALSPEDADAVANRLRGLGYVE